MTFCLMLRNAWDIIGFPNALEPAPQANRKARDIFLSANLMPEDPTMLDLCLLDDLHGMATCWAGSSTQYRDADCAQRVAGAPPFCSKLTPKQRSEHFS